MVGFGEKLSKQRHGSWEAYYIDYGHLKALIKPSNEAAKASATNTAGTIKSSLSLVSMLGATDAVASAPTKVFKKELDTEIEKAVLFLLEEQGQLAAQLSMLNVEKQLLVERFISETSSSSNFQSDGSPSALPSVPDQEYQTLQTVQDLILRYRQIGDLVLEFVHFIELNVTAVRKILKKHDKGCSSRLKLSGKYLATYTNESRDSHLHQLYHYGGLSALVSSLRHAFAELEQMEYLLRSSESQLETESEASMIVTRNDALNSESVATYIPEEQILKRINNARQRLNQSTKYVEIIASQALLLDDHKDSFAEGTSEAKEMTRSQRISAFLNLVSTFLYMTNYYIVAPTGGQYASLLGSTEAMAGIIIGMTPNAALIATVLYGWWSNYSYKSALIFAATSSLLGNVFYAMALHYDSLTMVMIGRFLNGFGSARSINRRFIADTFSRADRTSASAQFVTAGALGMAAGPAIAAMIGKIKSNNDLWAAETAPGWIMFSFWSVFLVSAVLYFEEPERPYNKVPSTIVGTPSEKQGLLSNGGESQKPLVQRQVSITIPDKSPLYRNVPVMMTLWIYFVLKLVLECLLTSSPSLTRQDFGWNTQQTGAFLAMLGLLMFPANFAVAYLSHLYEDREMIVGALMIMFFSGIGFISYTPSYSVIQYMIFGILLFLSTNALEGPNMSLLSKTIPRSWARGTFNSGFLATEAGTVARSIGDLFIAGVAGVFGFSHLLNYIFVPLLLLITITLALTYKFYSQIIEKDDDDDSAQSS